MIQPLEMQSGAFGHPSWKRNMFAGLALCVVGIAMICSVVAAIFGVIVLAIGGTWAIIACAVGTMQERGDHKRAIGSDPQIASTRPLA